MRLDKEQLVWLMEDTMDNIGPADVASSVEWKEAAISADNVIKDVPVLGYVSKNGYTYSKDALRNAPPLYEGVDVYMNHERDKKQDRKAEDKFGFLRNIRFEESSGLRGDVVANPKHPYFEAFKWWAENHPERLGLSHHAGGKFNKKTNEVESITVVKSVDIVATPATVSGLRESVLQEGVIVDAIDSEKAALRFGEIIEKAVELIHNRKWDFQLSLAARAGGVAEIAKDLAMMAEEFNTTTTPNTTQEGEVMDWDKLNLSELTQKRPDIVESIAKDAQVRAQARQEKLTESVKDVPEKLRTELFLEQVRGAIDNNDEELLGKLVADRKSLSVVAQKPVSTGVVVPLKESATEEKIETRDEFLSKLPKSLRKGGK